MILFILMVNLSGFPLEEIKTDIGEIVTTKLSKREPIQKFHSKYLDDLTQIKELEKHSR